MDWFQTGKGVCQGCIFPSFLFKVHIESIMQNDSLDEVQVGIMIAQINIYNLRYADDTILMAQNEEELKSLMIKVKEESEKAGFKLRIH